MEIDSLDILHHNEVDRSSRFEVKGAGDIGVAEPGRSLRLASEPGQIGTLFDAFDRQNLDGHLVVERGVLRHIDTAHATGTQQSQQFVLAQQETLVPTLSQLFDLPGSEEARRDERLQQVVRHRPGGIAPGSRCRGEPRRLDEAAGLQHP